MSHLPKKEDWQRLAQIPDEFPVGIALVVKQHKQR